MSKEIICPDCGNPIAEGSMFCDECGAAIKPEPEVSQTPAAHQSGEVIGSGARANITGGVHTSHSTTQQLSKTNVDNSSRVDNSSVMTNTSSVDNSSTVNNSTTIVMNGSKDEYCAVCGNPLEEKHPRCPKCGKGICPDCRVPGKNRCVACEKKAVNEYRTAFQQLLLTTGGNIGVAGRQMMDQKAHDLDIEDKKSSIEADLMKAFKPAPKPVQPQVVVTEAKKPEAPQRPVVAEKGMVDERPAAPAPVAQKSSSSNSMLLGILVLAVVIGLVAFFMSTGDKSADSDAAVQAPAPAAVAPAPAPAAATPAPAAKPVATPAPAAKPAATPAPAAKPAEKPAEAPAPVQEVKTDANYEAGMAAYSAGKCLDAINAFNKSGTADAYYMIGLIYEEGCGTVGKNAMLARKNFKKAAQMGSAAAKAKL